MKICIPCPERASLDAELSPHFGRAASFVVVDCESGETTLVPNGGCGEDHGCCAPLEFLTEMDIDAVLCRSMGRHALARFEESGIGVFVSRRSRIWQALAEVWSGDIKRLVPEEACSGGHRHD